MDLEVLRKAPLFTNLDDEVFAILTSELTEVELSRGASAFHEGDQGDQLYVIMSGKIKLGRTASDGRENLVAVLGPGEIFGEMALFNPAPRNATATAVSATRLAGLRHENLRRAIASSPDVSVQLLQALAQRLSKTNESLADLVFSDVPGRVAKALLDLADRFGRPAADGLLVAHDRGGRVGRRPDQHEDQGEEAEGERAGAGGPPGHRRPEHRPLGRRREGHHLTTRSETCHADRE